MKYTVNGTALSPSAGMDFDRLGKIEGDPFAPRPEGAFGKCKDQGMEHQSRCMS